MNARLGFCLVFGFRLGFARIGDEVFVLFVCVHGGEIGGDAFIARFECVDNLIGFFRLVFQKRVQQQKLPLRGKDARRFKISEIIIVAVAGAARAVDMLRRMAAYEMKGAAND